MKIYAQTWAIEVLTQFRQRNPRVNMIDTAMIRYLKEREIKTDYGDIESRLVLAIRVPAVGKYIWRDYKAIVKRQPVNWEEIARLAHGLRLSSQMAQEEIVQMELEFGET